MAKKVLTWTNSQVIVWPTQLRRLLIHLVHVFESEFASGIKDVPFVFTYDLYVENGRSYYNSRVILLCF